ncbi:pectate lyase, partial [Bacteroidota bacterium]
MKKYTSVLLLSALSFVTMFAQKDIYDLRWYDVVFKQPDVWYGSEEARMVAENVLLYQRDIGGWPKNIAMQKVLSRKQKKELLEIKSVGLGATTDNGATCNELEFLSRIYGKTAHEPYKIAFLNGIDYLLEAQYENGGWPQSYPLKKGYSRHITYNDGSMINIMQVLKKISEKSDEFSIIADYATIKKAKTAYEKGVDIILKTQYKQNGKLSVWCAQHDEETLAPARARSYELPSLSGSESAGIVLLLMKIDSPSEEVVNAIQSAVRWFEKSKITGYRIEVYENEEGMWDRRLIVDKDAPAIWARFYDLEDNRPIFCDRDGIKKYSIAEISHERRNNYGYYSYAPRKVLDKYENWQSQWAPETLLTEPEEENVIANPEEEKAFEELLSSAWDTVFSDDCKGDWSAKWSLDGKIGYVENSAEGMAFHAGPEIKNDAHHAVLWTRESFSGDLRIDYDYTRIDERDLQVNIIYIEATGSGEGEYSKEIFDWNSLREVPSMRTYFNNMNTLHISYAALSEEGDYIRARRYRPDFGTGLQGTDLGASYNTGFFDTGVKHHITIIKKDFDLFMRVADSRKTVLYRFNYEDHPEIIEGRIGLRHMYSRSSLYSNFVV